MPTGVDQWQVEDVGAEMPTGIATMDLIPGLREEMLMYESALEIVLTKLRILRNEFRYSEDRSPIDNIQSRLKTPQSIADKVRRRHVEPVLDRVEAEIFDIAGVRIVCPFVSDVYRVADMLAKQSGLHILQRKDYITSPKPSGYRSLHLIILVDVDLSQEKRGVPVEIQLRTIAMNCWASAEHQLRYKKDFVLPQHVSDELRECARLMSLVDDKVQQLAEEVLRADTAEPSRKE